MTSKSAASPSSASPSGVLPPMDRAGRLDRARRAFDEHGVDAALITTPVNVRWLTGFTGSNGRLLIDADGAVLYTDGRYTEQSASELAAGGVDGLVTVHDAAPDGQRHMAERVGNATVGFEAGNVSVADHGQLTESLEDATLEPLGPVIAELRQIKDVGERARLERAAAIADTALASRLGALAPGVTERDFQLDLDRAMLDLGADALSFETIVASGPNSALPHARPSNRPFEDGDLVVIDFGAGVDGYGSDMTRTFCIGEPSERQLDLYDAVHQAQAAGKSAVRDGVDERSIHETCAGVLDERGYGDAFIHGTGHGIGLEIHEQPILSPRSVGILRAGLIVTVEPGAYLTGFGGVRVEDSVVVTASGCEPITHAPKGLVPAGV